MKNKTARIGSRGSDLALWQARWVQRELQARRHGLELSIEVIRTTGDRVLDAPLSRIGDKGLFTREIEAALLDGKIDLAVHSLKDLPTEIPPGLAIAAVCRREDVRDVFLPRPGNDARKLLDQPDGATIATGSLRRSCQLLHRRPDFKIVNLRGNLNTRLRKLDESDWAGMILARAGVERLGWDARIGEVLDTDLLLPAVGQGALAVEVRADDRRIQELVKTVADWETTQATLAERALLRRLEGGCQIPIGAYARIVADGAGGPLLRLDAIVGSLDGRTVVRGKNSGDPDAPESVGTRLADTLLTGGADAILREIRETASKPA